MTSPARTLDPSMAFANLDPDTVLNCVESLGFVTDGRLLALNSFENRVYQVGIERDAFAQVAAETRDGDAASAQTPAPLIAKFYRTPRWSDAAILEEHALCFELQDADLQIVAPLQLNGASLFHRNGLRFALFPRIGGRAPNFDQLDVAERLGRTIARLHTIGARARFQARATLNPTAIISHAMHAARQSNLLPSHLHNRYASICAELQTLIQAEFDAIAPRTLRLHGDCHPGNVLWRDEAPWFVDFDDALQGPAVQDLWMLMSGDAAQRTALLEGYQTFREFDLAELRLIEPLRLLRQVRHAAWIAERWHDPAFPRAFAHVGEAAYWERHVMDLQEAALQWSASDWD